MANKYTAGQPGTWRAKVLDYVSNNPGATTLEISRGASVPYDSVSRSLSWFKQKGLVKKEIRGETSACSWSLVDDDCEAGFNPNFCIWRKTWEPMNIKQQTIFSSLGL